MILLENFISQPLRREDSEIPVRIDEKILGERRRGYREGKLGLTRGDRINSERRTSPLLPVFSIDKQDESDLFR